MSPKVVWQCFMNPKAIQFMTFPLRQAADFNFAQKTHILMMSRRGICLGIPREAQWNVSNNYARIFHEKVLTYTNITTKKNQI